MKLFRYTLSQAKRGSCPFRKEFNKDPWIVYHGTSNESERSIEEQGFSWEEESYSKKDVYRLVEIFKKLHWMGNFAGFGVLGSYAVNDFQHGGGSRKPVYFAESSARALLYAGHDHAGGETARAIRHAFKDLDKYLTCDELRASAIEATWKRLRDLYRCEVPQDCQPVNGNPPSFSHLRALWLYYQERGFRVPFGKELSVEPIDFTEDWLSEQLTELRHLRQACDSIGTNFRYGLVYAVRMMPDDVSFLSYSSWAGLAAHRAIPPDRIVAKAVIPRGFQYEKRSDLLAAQGNLGVVAAVEKHQAENPQLIQSRHKTQP